MHVEVHYLFESYNSVYCYKYVFKLEATTSDFPPVLKNINATISIFSGIVGMVIWGGGGVLFN